VLTNFLETSHLVPGFLTFLLQNVPSFFQETSFLKKIFLKIVIFSRISTPLEK
jgi:hypothetical protein